MFRPLLLVIVSLAAPADRVPASAKSYDPIDEQVARVESGGLWEKGGRRGRYRAVVRTRCSPEHCYDDLFLEWLQITEGKETSGPKVEVVATKRIEEVGGLTSVVRVAFIVSKVGTRLEVDQTGETLDGEGRWTICLDLDAPDTYKGRKGPCRKSG